MSALLDDADIEEIRQAADNKEIDGLEIDRAILLGHIDALNEKHAAAVDLADATIEWNAALMNRGLSPSPASRRMEEALVAYRKARV